MASEVKVKVSLLSGAVQTGLTKVKAQFSEFRSELNSSFGNFLALGGILAGLGAVVRKGHEIQDVAERFGLSGSENLQRVTNVAQKQGATLEDVARAWNKLEINRQKALDGNDEARKSFQDLGVSMQDVKRLSVEDLFNRIADATMGADDRGHAYAATVALMGRGAGVLYSTLEQGSKAIRGQGDAIGVMSDSAVENLDHVADTFLLVKNRALIFGGGVLIFFKGVAEAIGGAFGTAANVVERSISTMGAALKLAAHGHFIEAGKALASGTVDNARATLAELKALNKDTVTALKDSADTIGGRPTSAGSHSRTTKRLLDTDIDPSNKEQTRLEKIATLRERLEEIQRKAGNEQLDTEEKILAMVKQRAALLKEAASTKDDEKKLELEIKAAEITQEIFATQKQFEETLDKGKQAPNVSADQLQRIGGGGRAAVTGVDANLREQKAHTILLKQIAENTKAKQEIDLKMR